MNAAEEKLLLGFIEQSEASYDDARIAGWKIMRDDDGWIVELLSEDKATVWAGKGRSVGEAVAALVHGLDDRSDLVTVNVQRRS